MIKKSEVKNILITRTDRLGDVVLTLPLVTETKKVFKDAKIFFLLKKNLRELLYDYEGIDELIFEEDINTFSGKYKFFKKKKPDLVINVKPKFDIALIFFLLGIKYRIGTGYRWYSFLYNYKVYEHRKTSVKHESEYNLNLLRSFFSEVRQVKEFHFRYPADERNNLENKLKEFKFSLKDNFIIIHPGSGGSAKDLPAGKLTGFINVFLKDYPGFKIIMTGLDNEKILADNILESAADISRNSVINTAGKLNLRELMILIDNSKLFISNSTGPMHIAGALNKNIICFFPNEAPMSDIRWKPPGDHVTVIKPDLETGDMNSINVEEINKAAKNILK
ncbi:MAG: glycosyltransferase family 9 protein [Ignavibacteria bacterium]|nr:glycosyltransferase family 9 protein [Ignavibacteria bacterium]